MATVDAQRKWRDKNRFVKHQLNVMARRQIHRYLEDIAGDFGLRGKGEAVTFASFLTRALMQRGDNDDAIRQMLEDYADSYRRDRDIYSA
jgi:hypothetical protein